VQLSPELTLAAECCRRNFGGDEANPLPARTGSIDWARFVRVVRFHRVEGLVWKALNSVAIPDHASRALSSDAVNVGAANLRAAAESQRLLSAFDRVGLPLLFVKGLTLAVLAYGTIATKSGVDIDVLVDRQHLEQASALLQELGYRLVQPTSIDKLPVWHDLRKESTWLKDDRGRLQIDLHTRLADSPQLIPTLGLNSPRQPVEVAPGIELPTLAEDELFAYLAVHGSSSAWFRLKWISDLAATIHGKPAEELERLYRRSQELGAGRAPAQALLLADRLFESLCEVPALKRLLERDGRNRWLCRIAYRGLVGAPEPREPTSRPLGTAAIHASQFLLLPGPAFKLSELARQVRTALA
jgi:hypothetical protein